MSRVNVNNFGLRYAIESSLGTAPTTGWRTLEPNSVGSFGANISTVARRPISQDRGRKKGTATNLESAVEFDADLTMDAFTDFAEGFVFAEFANKEFDLREGGEAPEATAASDDFGVDSVSAALAAKFQDPSSGSYTLLYAKGYSNAANNGLHEVGTAVSSTDTEIAVSSALVDEDPGTTSNASLQIAGIRVAIADLAFTKTGATATIVSSADITDWSALGLFAGQYIHVGSDDGSGERQNMFDDGVGGDVYGYARITSIDGATLNLDKLDTHLDTTDASNATVVDIMFGRFLRNVAVTADSADEEFLERTYHFEGEYPDLGGVGTDEYEYSVGNYASELSINMPLTDKASATWSFIGTNTEDITDSRKTGPSDAIAPLRTTAINTSADIASLTTDVISSASDVCFKSLTLTLNNNVTPENCLGTYGATFVNSGLFEVNLEGQMLFTNKAIVNAVKNNTTVTFAAILKNDDGAIAIDIPSLTLGGGGREFPQDQSVLVNVSGEAFNDPSGTIPNVSLGISLFPSVPTDRS